MAACGNVDQSELGLQLAEGWCNVSNQLSKTGTITICSSLERKSGSIFLSAKLVFIKPYFIAVKFFP